MEHRRQQTIHTDADVKGVGFLTGADVTLRFLPAPADHGVVFQRVDLAEHPTIPASLDYTVPRQRRTAIERDGAVVEMVEHVLAALFGLNIDNCLVQLNAPEPPGLDGSSQAFVEALLAAGIVEQDQLRPMLCIENTVRTGSADVGSEVTAAPLNRRQLAITYYLDYGPTAPIPPQQRTVVISPETFVSELAAARTFVLEAEAHALRAQGYGSRTTARDLLIFGKEGVIDNSLRFPDECVRHKILDCVGDFALLGCDLCGHIRAYRSGHELNRDTAAKLRASHSHSTAFSQPEAA